MQVTKKYFPGGLEKNKVSAKTCKVATSETSLTIFGAFMEWKRKSLLGKDGA